MLKSNDIGTSDDFRSSTGSSNPTDPELARVVTAWATLPDPIKRAILALVGTTTEIPTSPH
ncbi:hypothetical protein R5W23_001158 [Gemmata sp. JC673]|uniref:Uncharacterized protein n=1 Tax=Gemmata algarum TaxID=2975278 RepID=A0ABU5EXF7_9BACT|nr:hypothetical protein [Gemmata algarum]MDY3559960.1 hypothetical protein [Gemmata algarum]